MLDVQQPVAGTKISRFLEFCFRSQPSTAFPSASWRALLGISVLYASAYYLPLLRPKGAYFLQSSGFFSLVILPSIVSVGVGWGVLYVLRAVSRKWSNALGTPIFVVGALSILTLIALKGLFYAAGSDWRDVVARHHELVSPILISTIHEVKNAATLCVIVFVWSIRGQLTRLIRVLSSLGFAFGCLAMIKIATLSWNMAHQHPVPPASGHFAAQQSPPTDGGIPQRRVVWVIFDETDFDLAFIREHRPEIELPNFNWLSRHSVFATAANSPASATIYSIPALLTAVPIGGDGITVNDSATLSLEGIDGKSVPFVESTTIFGALAATARNASILGFYHPYCKLFATTRCDSFAWPEVGGWEAGLQSNLPDSLSLTMPWDDITKAELRLLPAYVDRDDALTFLHLNFPHLPADYADRYLNLVPSADPLTEYDHNLLFADRALGEILERLRAQKTRGETLLVVSTDHWLRNQWYRANRRDEMRHILFMAWKVGDENDGTTITRPLSSVHTAEMILAYLNGQITTPADIVHWWEAQRNFPSYIAP